MITSGRRDIRNLASSQRRWNVRIRMAGELAEVAWRCTGPSIKLMSAVRSAFPRPYFHCVSTEINKPTSCNLNAVSGFVI